MENIVTNAQLKPFEMNISWALERSLFFRICYIYVDQQVLIICFSREKNQFAQLFAKTYSSFCRLMNLVQRKELHSAE